jgi:hypothetical protein
MAPRAEHTEIGLLRFGWNMEMWLPLSRATSAMCQQLHDTVLLMREQGWAENRIKDWLAQYKTDLISGRFDGKLTKAEVIEIMGRIHGERVWRLLHAPA